MFEIINFNELIVPLQVWNNNKVVTFNNISEVYNYPSAKIRYSFSYHNDLFIEGVDYFHIYPNMLKDHNNQFSGISKIRRTGCNYFTENGYVKLMNLLNNKQIHKDYEENLIGKSFGELTVIDKAEDYIDPSTGRHRSQWLCQCTCGNYTIVRTCNLIYRDNISCGCKKGDYISHLRQKPSSYDLSQDYGVGYTNEGDMFLFDKDDYNLISRFAWHKDAQGYFVASVRSNDDIPNKTVRLHRLVMNFTDKELVIDHKNGLKYDNRKVNLRIATFSQNSMNHIIAKNSKYGISGVYWSNHLDKWVATINDRQKHTLKYTFDNYDDAVRKRRELEEKYYGEFSYVNSRGGGM